MQACQPSKSGWLSKRNIPSNLQKRRYPVYCKCCKKGADFEYLWEQTRTADRYQNIWLQAVSITLKVVPEPSYSLEVNNLVPFWTFEQLPRSLLIGITSLASELMSKASRTYLYSFYQISTQPFCFFNSQLGLNRSKIKNKQKSTIKYNWI